MLRRSWSLPIGAALILTLPVGEALSAPPKSQTAGHSAPAARSAPASHSEGDRLHRSFAYHAFGDPKYAHRYYGALRREGWMVVETANAAALHQLYRLPTAFPGDESTWFVLVMQNGFHRRIELVQGRTAAALTVVSFSGTFLYRAFANPVLAEACYQALIQ